MPRGARVPPAAGAPCPSRMRPDKAPRDICLWGVAAARKRTGTRGRGFPILREGVARGRAGDAKAERGPPRFSFSPPPQTIAAALACDAIAAHFRAEWVPSQPGYDRPHSPPGSLSHRAELWEGAEIIRGTQKALKEGWEKGKFRGDPSEGWPELCPRVWHLSGPLSPLCPHTWGYWKPPQRCPDRAEWHRGVPWGGRKPLGDGKGEQRDPGWCTGQIHVPPPSGVPRLPSASLPKPSSASPALAGCCALQVPLRVPKPGQASPSPLGPSPALSPNNPAAFGAGTGLGFASSRHRLGRGLLRTLISPPRPPLSPRQSTTTPTICRSARPGMIKRNSWNNFSHPHIPARRGRGSAAGRGAVRQDEPSLLAVPCSPR